MRRTPRNLWMTLRGPSSLWTTRSGKGAKESVAASTTDRAFARLRIYNRPRVCASVLGNVRHTASGLSICAPVIGNAREGPPQVSALKRASTCNLILPVATGWHVMVIKPTESRSRFLLAGGPFHRVRMGVERTAR
jgi:hypothetical protein